MYRSGKMYLFCITKGIGASILSIFYIFLTLYPIYCAIVDLLPTGIKKVPSYFSELFVSFWGGYEINV